MCDLGIMHVLQNEPVRNDPTRYARFLLYLIKVEVFLDIFHWEKMFEKLHSKKLSRNKVQKTLQLVLFLAHLS